MNANDERDYAEEAANAQLMRDEHENPDPMLADPWRLYPMIRTLPEPEHWSDGGPGHTHHYDPLCAAWALPDWAEVTPCDHGSCLEQVYEPCQACFAEAMDEMTGVTQPMMRCGVHGDQLITGGGYNGGFAGEGVQWVMLACGDSVMW